MILKKTKNIIEKNKFNFIHLTTTSSTMDDAKINLKKLKSNFVIIADQQTRGKGRRGNTWFSPPGNLYCSIFFPLKRGYPTFSEFSVITPVIISKVLENFLDKKKISFKWPNDILLNGKKICGILLETKVLDNITALVIGIGVNLLSAPNLAEDHRVTTEPSSILDETNINLDPIDLSKSIAHHFSLRENQFRTLGFSKIREIWTERAAKIGKEILVCTPNSEYHGIFDSIDEKGQLIILNNGEKNKIAAAEIFF